MYWTRAERWDPEVRLPVVLAAQSPRSLDNAGRFRANLEDTARPEEANIKFEEKVDLAEDDRNGVRLRPRESQPDGWMFPNGRCYDQDASLGGCEVPGQLDGRRLTVPNRAEPSSDAVGKYVNRCPAIDETKDRQTRFSEAELDRKVWRKARSPCRRVHLEIGKLFGGRRHFPVSSSKTRSNASAAPKAWKGDQTG